jgi:hypothetical protein
VGLKRWRLRLCKRLLRILPDEVRVLVIEDLVDQLSRGVLSGRLQNVRPLDVPVGSAYYIAVLEASENDELAQAALKLLIDKVDGVGEEIADQFGNVTLYHRNTEVLN